MFILTRFSETEAAAQRLRLAAAVQHPNHGLRRGYRLRQRLAELGHQQLKAAAAVQHGEGIPDGLLQKRAPSPR